MPGPNFWWKAATVILAIAVIYLGIRDYQESKWLRDKLWTGWIQANTFTYQSGGGPPDPTKPPEPPPPFGF